MAQFVVVVVSLLAIYRQLRAQGSANAVQRIESPSAGCAGEQDGRRFERSKNSESGIPG
jgi:hypothetical protein